MFNESLGKLTMAIDCKLRECRARKVEGWENDTKLFNAVSTSSQELCELLLQDGSKRSLRDGQMWLGPIVKRTADTFGEQEDYLALVKYSDRLASALAAKEEVTVLSA